MDILVFSRFHFHGLKVLSKYSVQNTIPKLNQFLIITILHWFILVNMNDGSCRSNRKRLKSCLCCHSYQNSKGILTFFPFPFLMLWDWLGPTNPWLIDIVKEPLPFQWQRFSLCLDPTTTRILISARCIPILKGTSTLAERLPITRTAVRSIVSVINLVPSTFKAYCLDE